MVPEAPKNIWPSLARAAFVLATLIAAGWLVAREWDHIAPALVRANGGLIMLALIMTMINVAITGLSWRALLTHAPVQLTICASAQIFFLGQIGKYLPGTVWSFLASGEIAKRAGFPRGATMSSLMLALIIGVGSGGLVALLLVQQTIGLISQNMLAWMVGLGACVLALLPPVRSRLLKFARIDFPVSIASMTTAGALAISAWLFAGAQIVLLSQAIEGSLGWGDLLFATGSYALAWIAGFLFFIAPAGLGAREGVLVTLLAVQMPLADAMVVALLSRLVMTLSDFCLAGLAGALNSAPLRPIEPAGE